MDNKHIRQQVLKFLSDNGQSVIVCCYANCLDVKRRASSMLFDEQTFIKFGMQTSFTDIMRKQFGKNVQIDFDVETLTSNEKDFFCMQYDKLLERYYIGHEKSIKQKAIECMQNIDELFKEVNNL